MDAWRQGQDKLLVVIINTAPVDSECLQIARDGVGLQGQCYGYG